eukprot:6499750-Alexandrium_andersonii.AAC.1
MCIRDSPRDPHLAGRACRATEAALGVRTLPADWTCGRSCRWPPVGGRSAACSGRGADLLGTPPRRGREARADVEQPDEPHPVGSVGWRPRLPVAARVRAALAARPN